MLYSVSGIMMQNNVSKPQVHDLWANNVDDARAYFEMAVKAVGAQMFQIHSIEADDQTKLFHPYQVNESRFGFEIVKERFNDTEKHTEVIIVAEDYDDRGMAVFDCYALINGLMEEPIPLLEQYIINTK